MNKKAFIYIILAGLLWGTSGVFVHFLAPLGYTTMQMTAARGSVSAIAICTYVAIYDKSLFKIKPAELFLFFLSGTFIFLAAVFYYSAMQASSVSTAVVLMYTAPVFVLVYSVAFFGERLTVMKGIAVLGMILGCALVSGIAGGIKFSPWGIFAGFASGISYAIYNIVTKIEMRKGSNPLSATVYNFIFMAVIALCACNVPEMLSLTAADPMPAVFLMIGLGIFTCVTPYFLYTLAIKQLPVGVASALGIVEPMAATIYSVVFFGEKLSVLSSVGIAFILLSVFMLGKSKE